MDTNRFLRLPIPLVPGWIYPIERRFDEIKQESYVRAFRLYDRVDASIDWTFALGSSSTMSYRRGLVHYGPQRSHLAITMATLTVVFLSGHPVSHLFAPVLPDEKRLTAVGETRES